MPVPGTEGSTVVIDDPLWDALPHIVAVVEAADVKWHRMPEVGQPARQMASQIALADLEEALS